MPSYSLKRTILTDWGILPLIVAVPASFNR